MPNPWWPPRLVCLSTGSPVGGTVGEGLGALFEKACRWEWALGFQKTQAIPSALSLPRDPGSRYGLSAAGATTPWLCGPGPQPFEPQVQLNTVFYKLPWPQCSDTAIEP